MKINNKQYATALYESAKGKSQSEVNEIVANFVKVLAKNYQTKMASKIIEKFNEVWNKENNIIEAKVVSREELNRDLRAEIEKYIKKKYDGDKVEIEEIIDEKIKGGIIIKVGDEVIDGSVENKLAYLKKILQN